jgi:prephenate dehydrogenase
VTVAVVGAGLIGGSVALAARTRLGVQVRAYDPDEDARAAAARRLGASSVCGALEEALDGAQIAVVAAPLGAMHGALAATLAVAGPDCLVTDVGSTKRALVSDHDDPRYVGGHPLAGAEAAGIGAARESLFADATWYLTPTARTQGTLLERAHRLVSGLGAHPVTIDAATHDRLVATVSHLPHMLANVLVGQAARAAGEDHSLPATGPSFRDTTRVAGANPALWPDIYLANADALVAAIDEAVAALADARACLTARDRPALEAWQEQAATQRRVLLEAGGFGGPTALLRVAVANRPGVIAQLALTLGRGGVNISDMSLSPSPDGRNGVVTLWVAAAAADRAAKLLADGGHPVTT